MAEGPAVAANTSQRQQNPVKQQGFNKGEQDRIQYASYLYKLCIFSLIRA